MLKLLQSPMFNLAVSAAAVAVATALFYTWLGFLGVALVGLLIGFVAVQADLGQETTRGFEARHRMSRSERVAHGAEIASRASTLTAAKLLGLVLSIAAAAGFVFLQLPR